MPSKERNRLQPWVMDAFHPQRNRFISADDWFAAKLEDRFRPGWPDCLIKHKPSGRVWLTELKWSALRTKVRIDLSPNQWQHLKEWSAGPADYSSLAVVGADCSQRVYVVPIVVLSEPSQSLDVDEVDRLPGVRYLDASRAALRDLPRLLLDAF